MFHLLPMYRLLRTHLRLFLACSAFAIVCGCEDKAEAERVAESRKVICDSMVTLQSLAKLTGETLEPRVARIEEFQTSCPSDRFQEILEVDDEAMVAWLMKQVEDAESPAPEPSE